MAYFVSSVGNIESIYSVTIVLVVKIGMKKYSFGLENKSLLFKTGKICVESTWHRHMITR